LLLTFDMKVSLFSIQVKYYS